MEPRVSLLTLGVGDLTRARQFYEHGLGWPVSSASVDDVVFFRTGGVIVALYPREKLAEDVGVAAEGSGFRGYTLAHNARSMEDVDAVMALAERAGAVVVKPAQRAFWGGYSGYFADPDGHLWEVAWNPHFAFGEDGSLALP